MTPDYNKAATKATETLLKYGINSTPISPLQILKRIDNVIVTSFSEMSDSNGMSRRELVPMFGRNRDAISSIHTENGKQIYVVAYNAMLPMSIVQKTLARELGHIVLKHKDGGQKNSLEADCFACHLLCPRPVVHFLQVTNIRITVEVLANLTGLYDQSLFAMRRIPGTDVPQKLNNFVRNQFMPFLLNLFDYYQYIIQDDRSALADFGSYMDNYEER